MDEFYKRELENALNSENVIANAGLFSKTKAEHDMVKKDVLSSLGLSPIRVDEFLKKLDEYQYVDEFDEFKSGSFLRWINLGHEMNAERLSLTRGAHFCSVSVSDTGCNMVCRSGSRFFQVCFDTCIFFQKLTFQEQILLNAISVVVR